MPGPSWTGNSPSRTRPDRILRDRPHHLIKLYTQEGEKPNKVRGGGRKGQVHLPHAVSTVDQEIGTGHVGAGVADEVDVGTLELLGLTVAAHGDHGEPEVLDLLVDKVGETGVDVAGGDGVDTGKVAPLVGEGAGHVDAAGLGDVVGGLLLGEVGDVAGHGGGDDEATGTALLEVRTDGLGAVEGTGQVGLDDLLPVLDGAVEDTAGGGAAGVGDEGVDLAKLLDHVVDEVLDALPATDVALVGLDLDTVLLGQLLGVLLTSLGAGGVGDGQVGAHLGTAAGGLDTHAAGTGGTGDDDDLALEAEEVLERVGLRNGNHDDGGEVSSKLK